MTAPDPAPLNEQPCGERTEGPTGASVVVADPGGTPVALFVPGA